MRIVLYCGLIWIASGFSPAQLPAPAASLPSPEQIKTIVQQVTQSQVDYLTHKNFHYSYRVHRVDRKEDTTRQLIESTDGTVARLLLHNGQPLTAEENDGEHQRLSALLNTSEFQHDVKDQKRSRSYGTELIQAMPQAMSFTLTPGQPQLPDLSRRQFVLDYTPNPEFHPKSLAEQVLLGLAGRVWIDQEDHHLVRIEIRVVHDVNLAAGVLAKVYSGGTVNYDQRRIAEGQYAYTHITMHLRLRELMVHTAPFDSEMTATDIQPLSPAPDGAASIRALLALPVKTR